jgi:cytochrome c oxidase subunit II
VAAGLSIRTICPYASLTLLASCSNEASALSPAGEEAEAIYILFLTMAGSAGVIWVGIVALMIYGFRAGRRAHPRQASQALILWGGAVFPTVTLLLLLSYALWLMPNIRPWTEADGSGVRIEVTGEQYWWRIRYLDQQGEVLFETANELLLPLDEPTTFSLRARDVIHSFWIPALGGKMDMIPGRENRLTLTPTRPGIYRGPCAEFCGTSHALMTATAKVVAQPEFDAWLKARRQRPTLAESEGARLFFRHGCPACHAVDGMSQANERIGPNLTAFGQRLTVGAGALENTPDNIARFIADPAAIKPGATMPAFHMLPPAEIDAMAAWLGDLQ